MSKVFKDVEEFHSFMNKMGRVIPFDQMPDTVIISADDAEILREGNTYCLGPKMIRISSRQEMELEDRYKTRLDRIESALEKVITRLDGRNA